MEESLSFFRVLVLLVSDSIEASIAQPTRVPEPVPSCRNVFRTW